jgi:apolipoprotein N-acyltransferase
LKARWIQRIVASRSAWAALGGLGLAASFPKLSIAGLAWLGPGWILFSALGRKPAEVFRIGFVGGLAYGLTAFYWILLIPFPAGAIPGWLLLGAYLALYTASWVWFCWRIFPGPKRADSDLLEILPLASAARIDASGDGAGAESISAIRSVADPGLLALNHRSAWVGMDGSVQQFLAVPLAKRVVWALGCAAAWVALEMLLARLFTGFPWNLLGVSQYQILPVIQIASWTGVYGVSFLIAWFSVSLGGAALTLMARPTQSKGWVGEMILPLLVLVGVIAYGSTELVRPRPVARTLKTVLIQPSIPQTLIWDTNQSALRFTQLVELSERALTQTSNAQLLVWPEAAVPNMLRYELETYRAVTNLAVRHQVWIILGSDDAVPGMGGKDREYEFYNSSFLITPRGEVAGAYRKRNLVIFGEYIPLERWLPFMKYVTPVGGSFSSGRGPAPFTLPELQVKTSVLICFEDIFPHFGREYVSSDIDFLLNLTNNGWFGESAAQWQHAANAVFRTVENRIVLVRCANNGLTCWVDQCGAMHSVYFGSSPNVYGEGYKVVNVPLLAEGSRRTLTFYTRHGDWFGWSCVAVTGALLCWILAKQKRSSF